MEGWGGSWRVVMFVAGEVESVIVLGLVMTRDSAVEARRRRSGQRFGD